MRKMNKGSIINNLEMHNPREQLLAIILTKSEVEEYILSGRQLSAEGWDEVCLSYLPTVSLEEFIDDSWSDVVFWADEFEEDDDDDDDEPEENEEPPQS